MPRKPPPPPDDDHGETWSWDQYWSYEGGWAWTPGEIYERLVTIMQYKLAALETDLRTEADIFALVTTLPAKVKVADRAAHLKRLVDALGERPYRVQRQPILNTLLAAYRHWLDVLYDSARRSQQKLSAEAWDAARRDLRAAFFTGLALIPAGNPLAQALTTALRHLDDRTQWAAVAADYVSRPAGNSVNQELTTVRQWYLIPLLKAHPDVQNDLMRLMGMLKDREELEVDLDR